MFHPVVHAFGAVEGHMTRYLDSLLCDGLETDRADGVWAGDVVDIREYSWHVRHCDGFWGMKLLVLYEFRGW